METTAKFLAGSKLPSGEHLFDSPEDVIKAAELLAGRDSSDTGEVRKATAQEVLRARQLPLLDPAFQLGLGLGVLSSVMGGPKENLPLVEISLRSESTQNSVQAEYDIDMQREGSQLRGNGTVNNDSFAEVAGFHEGKVHWRSALGLKASGLTIEVGEDEKSVTMRGDMAGVPTDLTLNLLLAENGNMAGVHTVGKFNGEDYSMRSTVDMGGLLKGEPQHHGEMVVTGLVNGETTERKYRVNVNRSGGDLEFRAQTDEKQPNDRAVGVSVKIIDRRP
jgi:hypothetical protein